MCRRNTLKRFEGKAKRVTDMRNERLMHSKDTDKIKSDVENVLMLGNEAVARGAYEAGVRVAVRLSRNPQLPKLPKSCREVSG